MAKREYAKVLVPGTHASTFGGTPLACAAAIAVLDTFEHEKILENCKLQGEYLVQALSNMAAKYKCIQTVRGAGLMVGIVMNCDVAAMIGKMLENGLIILSAGENVLRLLPPLNVSREEIDLALAIMEREFAAIG
jgi:acetylornithine/succinyldiaminopimelate/putrescine aminotransferase